MMITDDDGNIGHSELSLGTATSWSGEFEGPMVSPASTGGANTQTNPHPAHGGYRRPMRPREGCRAPNILAEPEDQFYGDRTYRCKDPEGHMWTFGQTLRTVSNEDMEKAAQGGLKVEPG